MLYLVVLTQFRTRNRVPLSLELLYARMAAGLGATPLVPVFLGNMSGAVILDHFGWFGLPPRPVSPNAIIGIALVLACALVTANRP